MKVDLENKEILFIQSLIKQEISRNRMGVQKLTTAYDTYYKLKKARKGGE